MNIRKKIQLFEYYMKKNTNQPVSIIPIILDALFINFIAFFIIYLFIVYKTKSPLISILLSSVALILLDITILIKKYNSYTISRNKRRKETIVKHLSYRINQLNEQEFQLQLIKILLNNKKFSNIYKEKKLLKADYNNTTVAIGFHHPPPGEKTPFLKIWEFVQQAKNLGFMQGFFFTSSTFEENCNKERIKDTGFSIHLMDINYILDIMEKQGMFPDEFTVDLLIEEEIRKEKTKKQETKNKIFSSNKSRQFLSTSVFFLVIGILFKSFRFYCLSLSIILSIFAFLIRLKISKFPKSDLLSNDGHNNL